MGWIILLIALGLLLYFAELVLLPGITIAAIGAFCCLVAATSWAFAGYGVATGIIVLVIVLVLLGIITALFLRPKTWKKVSLHTEIKESIDTAINLQVAIGAHGQAITRLAPMGKVMVDGKVFEAKTMGSYVDEHSKIEVLGYDNSALIVKTSN